MPTQSTCRSMHCVMGLFLVPLTITQHSVTFDDYWWLSNIDGSVCIFWKVLLFDLGTPMGAHNLKIFDFRSFPMLSMAVSYKSMAHKMVAKLHVWWFLGTSLPPKKVALWRRLIVLSVCPQPQSSQVVNHPMFLVHVDRSARSSPHPPKMWLSHHNIIYITPTMLRYT